MEIIALCIFQSAILPALFQFPALDAHDSGIGQTFSVITTQLFESRLEVTVIYAFNKFENIAADMATETIEAVFVNLAGR